MKIDFEQEMDGRWIADLAGVLAYGRTEDEARDRVLEVWMEAKLVVIKGGLIPASVIAAMEGIDPDASDQDRRFATLRAKDRIERRYRVQLVSIGDDLRVLTDWESAQFQRKRAERGGRQIATANDRIQNDVDASQIPESERDAFRDHQDSIALMHGAHRAVTARLRRRERLARPGEDTALPVPLRPTPRKRRDSDR